jgi:hypothetical protein
MRSSLSLEPKNRLSAWEQESLLPGENFAGYAAFFNQQQFGLL